MESLGDVYIESSHKTFQRLMNFKNYLNLFLEKNKLEDNEKILVIGHSVLFKHLMSTQLEENSFIPLKSENVLKNCEIAGISFEYWSNVKVNQIAIINPTNF